MRLLQASGISRKQAREFTGAVEHADNEDVVVCGLKENDVAAVGAGADHRAEFGPRGIGKGGVGDFGAALSDLANKRYDAGRVISGYEVADFLEVTFSTGCEIDCGV